MNKNPTLATRKNEKENIQVAKEEIENSKDIEYELWSKRNKEGLMEDTDGLLDDAIQI